MRARLLHDEVFRRLSLARNDPHEHQAEPLALTELACQAALSRYHFLRLFRQAFGIMPHQYLIRIRGAR